MYSYCQFCSICKYILFAVKAVVPSVLWWTPLCQRYAIKSFSPAAGSFKIRRVSHFSGGLSTVHLELTTPVWLDGDDERNRVSLCLAAGAGRLSGCRVFETTEKELNSVGSRWNRKNCRNNCLNNWSRGWNLHGIFWENKPVYVCVRVEICAHQCHSDIAIHFSQFHSLQHCTVNERSFPKDIQPQYFILSIRFQTIFTVM